ncbi:hypothetical protein NECAME_01865 [Necator americanus]|uniref:Uncharacterized protein n=1 Tax=Necator americanus TaxID=51031 RepID=W2TPK3_NECAM|nr:hypothetical protein NECAME_01865 [Necator americanus]ETN83066.1 hypothetical protein NECAME_01865 [Necator americanus]
MQGEGRIGGNSKENPPSCIVHIGTDICTYLPFAPPPPPVCTSAPSIDEKKKEHKQSEQQVIWTCHDVCVDVYVDRCWSWRISHPYITKRCTYTHTCTKWTKRPARSHVVIIHPAKALQLAPPPTAATAECQRRISHVLKQSSFVIDIPVRCGPNIYKLRQRACSLAEDRRILHSCPNAKSLAAKSVFLHCDVYESFDSHSEWQHLIVACTTGDVSEEKRLKRGAASAET